MVRKLNCQIPHGGMRLDERHGGPQRKHEQIPVDIVAVVVIVVIVIIIIVHQHAGSGPRVYITDSQWQQQHSCNWTHLSCGHCTVWDWDWEPLGSSVA